MTIADSRVVAHRWLRNGEVVGHWMDGAPTERQMQAGRDCSQIGGVAWTVEYVSPLSLLAEAESRADKFQQEAMNMTVARNALQSRLDAVLALADRWEGLAKKFYELGSAIANAEAATLNNDARELRAALGGESPGNEEELK